jgi:hypothetical protein
VKPGADDVVVPLWTCPVSWSAGVNGGAGSGPARLTRRRTAAPLLMFLDRSYTPGAGLVFALCIVFCTVPVSHGADAYDYANAFMGPGVNRFSALR